MQVIVRLGPDSNTGALAHITRVLTITPPSHAASVANSTISEDWLNG